MHGAVPRTGRVLTKGIPAHWNRPARGIPTHRDPLTKGNPAHREPPRIASLQVRLRSRPHRGAPTLARPALREHSPAATLTVGPALLQAKRQGSARPRPPPPLPVPFSPFPLPRRSRSWRKPAGGARQGGRAAAAATTRRRRGERRSAPGSPWPSAVAELRSHLRCRLPAPGRPRRIPPAARAAPPAT